MMLGRGQLLSGSAGIMLDKWMQDGRRKANLGIHKAHNSLQYTTARNERHYPKLSGKRYLDPCSRHCLDLAIRSRLRFRAEAVSGQPIIPNWAAAMITLAGTAPHLLCSRHKAKATAVRCGGLTVVAPEPAFVTTLGRACPGEHGCYPGANGHDA